MGANDKNTNSKTANSCNWHISFSVAGRNFGQLFCAASFDSASSCLISQDGKEVQRIAMDTVKNPHIIEITGEDGAWNRVWISEDSVKMESASCPDGLCVHQGAISDGLLPIVCLPNKVQIQIVEDNNEESSETEEFDAKVG